MRVLFFGTSEFAVPTLRALAACPDHTILAIVTQPDRPQGRGRHEAASSVKAAGAALGLPVLQPERVRSAGFVQTVRDMAPDVIVLASFGQIIPRSILAVPSRGPINLHASLLPSYRGAAPIHRALLDGEIETGVCTMWMEPALDTGDVLMTARLPIAPDDTTGTLTARLAELGAGILLETLRLTSQSACPRTPQDHARATYARAISPADACLDFGQSAAASERRVRAMSPKPGAVCCLGPKRLKVWSAAELPHTAAPPGTVVGVGPDGIDVATGDGVLRLAEVQPENGRRMTACDCARGSRILKGHMLTPVDV